MSRPEPPPIRELVTPEDYDTQAVLWTEYWTKVRQWRQASSTEVCVTGGKSNRTCVTHGLPLYPDGFCNEGRPV